MKKLLGLAFLFNMAVMPNQLHAQAGAKPSRFRAGLSFGLCATDIPGMDTRDNDSDFKKLGVSFGALVSTELSAKNTLQLEINFTQKGAQQQPDSANQGFYRLALNYIDVPLIFRHKLHINIRRKPMDKLEIEGGLALERLIGYGLTDGTNYPLTMNPGTLNLTTGSMLAGLNFNVTPNLYFCLRYSNSFIRALKVNSVPPEFWRYSYNNGNNQVFLFGAKYVFGKPKPLASKDNSDQTPNPQ